MPPEWQDFQPEYNHSKLTELTAYFSATTVHADTICSAIVQSKIAFEVIIHPLKLKMFLKF